MTLAQHADHCLKSNAADLQNQVRIGAEDGVFFDDGYGAYAGVVAVIALHVGDYLKVKMRRPVAVFGVITDLAEWLAFGQVLANRNIPQ